MQLESDRCPAGQQPDLIVLLGEHCKSFVATLITTLYDSKTLPTGGFRIEVRKDLKPRKLISEQTQSAQTLNKPKPESRKLQIRTGSSTSHTQLR